jgi:hypothetical protein
MKGHDESLGTSRTCPVPWQHRGSYCPIGVRTAAARNSSL